jgi:hypothetical protein
MGLSQIKDLPQSPFTGLFGIAFYQSNHSTILTYDFTTRMENGDILLW